MAASDKKLRKEKLFLRTLELFKTHSSFIIVEMSNITSSQLQQTKKELGSSTEILVGKNTVIKKALKQLQSENKNIGNIEEIISKIKGFVGIIFSKLPSKELKQIILNNERRTFAKVGAVAQEDLFIYSTLTTMTPDKTSFFQAMGIATKITKGKIEITQSSQVLMKGEKVTPSQSKLLACMDIKPLVYFMRMKQIYDNGEFYDPEILDIDEKDVMDMIKSVISQTAAVSLANNIHTKASVPYELMNGIMDSIKVALSSGYEIEEAKAYQ
ncbi:60S acidic ribosomal protein P0 [Spraguea lophii 42_110]|uniref:Large ribosomal subunit protein uL10 n=1 Tax=Spraguea lophii (strain 42_110) TaxID=1358809 RepID=S7WBY5_SPRLO|nr:60S acidic ribosomal protein P0 [Spraguea lophii 42_110]